MKAGNFVQVIKAKAMKANKEYWYGNPVLSGRCIVLSVSDDGATAQIQHLTSRQFLYLETSILMLASK